MDPRPARSKHAQIRAMRQRYPDFKVKEAPTGVVQWVGPVTPKACRYLIDVRWHRHASAPLVQVLDPVLTPPDGLTFDDFPHLWFCEDEPARSGLCLFDPEAHQWSPADLIAETTIPWTKAWLLYYELWRLTGEWHGTGVGPATPREMREAGLLKATYADPGAR